MTVKTNLGLVDFALEQIGEVYWYGTAGYRCVKGLLASKTKQYPAHYTPNRMARYEKDIQTERTCFDCVGLIKSYYWTNDAGKVVYGLDGRPDKGTAGMFTAAKEKGPIADMPEIPGLIVYLPGHVGVYIGDGQVVEARGFSYGVVLTKLRERKWTHWMKCPWIEYVDGRTAHTVDPVEAFEPALADRLLRYRPDSSMLSGADVLAVQKKLTQLGFNPGTADGFYGPKTANAVTAFQRARGILADGIVGPVTLTELENR